MIANLTQHAPTPEQTDVGVVDLPPDMRARLIALLNFTEIPHRLETIERARLIAEMVPPHAGTAMIGGALWLMGPLANALQARGIRPVFAFSQRVSVEDPATGTKTSVFRHVGFVDAV